jgi:pimeloyl-ACP methyl ester carboxylesterase
MTIWNTEERAGLGNTAGYTQKLISVPLMRGNPRAGNFDLYYFKTDFGNNPTPFKKLDKTILFCLGGPGRVLKPHDNIWFKELSLYGYKIVYFHLRGSGFSQIPESNDQDQYLRTEFAADDIEKIREDVFETDRQKPWDAVIGYSYGAVLAQQYASQYGNSVKKLILIGPISLDKFKPKTANPVEVYDEYEKEVKEIRISIIDEIYKLKIFHEQLKISEEQRAQIKEMLFAGQEGIFPKIEKNFGSEQSVIDNYENLSESSNGTNSLRRVGLNYKQSFFQALRDLQVYGRRIDNDGAVNQEAKLGELGEVIARALGFLGTVPSMSEPQNVTVITNAPRSIRALEVMGVYDGINRRFIKEWLLNGSKDVAKCIEQASGIGWKYISDDKNPGKKIGITEEPSIKPWSPADHPHDKSTLILKGSADPVTAAGQAESYLKQGIVGQQSILLNFHGVGHEFILPGVRVVPEELHKPDDIYPPLQGGNADFLNCLLYAFVEKDWKDFINVARPIWKRLGAEEDLGVTTLKPGQ